MKRLIKNATIINQGENFNGSILIEDKIITKIIRSNIPEKEYENISFDDIIDAQGLILIPGIIDDQVHFREPGSTHKGSIKTESKAAIMGGVTTYMDMPNTNPPTCSDAELQKKYNIAEKDSYSNYSFYIGASNTNLEEILEIDPSSYCGIKLFMGSSTGNMLVDNVDALKGLFGRAKKLIATHCEEEGIIRANLEIARERYGDDNIPFNMHPIIRSREACIESSRKAIKLAIDNNSSLHILHLSTKEEIGMIAEAQKINPKISGEICVHYLWFNDSMYDKYGAKIKCNPAIKSEEDMQALRKAVKDGIIKIIATDHAPHLLEEKNNTYLNSPSGLPLVQHSLQLMLELYKQGVFSIETIVDRMCHSPAERFNISKRGYIKEGYYADLVLLDINTNDPALTTLHPAYKCGWSPLADLKLSTSIERVIINGQDAVVGGDIKEVRGMKLNFNDE